MQIASCLPRRGFHAQRLRGDRGDRLFAEDVAAVLQREPDVRLMERDGRADDRQVRFALRVKLLRRGKQRHAALRKRFFHRQGVQRGIRNAD